MPMSDLNAFGYLFESLVIRDLRVYGQPLGGEVLHYRDQTQLEVDAIVDCGARWARFEVKLGGDTLIDEAAETLLAFAKRVETSRRGTPLLLARSSRPASATSGLTASTSSRSARSAPGIARAPRATTPDRRNQPDSIRLVRRTQQSVRSSMRPATSAIAPGAVWPSPW